MFIIWVRRSIKQILFNDDPWIRQVVYAEATIIVIHKQICFIVVPKQIGATVFSNRINLRDTKYTYRDKKQPTKHRLSVWPDAMGISLVARCGLAHVVKNIVGKAALIVPIAVQ